MENKAINITGQTVAVFFARDKDNASIGLSAHRNMLIIRQLATHKKVNDVITKEDEVELPKVVCDFQTVESVDAMMEILKRIRKNMEPDLMMQYCMAC